MKCNKLKIFRNVFANVLIISTLVLLVSITILGGTVGVFSSNNVGAIYKGNTKNQNVSLMINVYWGTEYVEPMLNILKENDVKATFFVGGSWVNKNPEVFTKIFESGNEIGNHGYWHKDHKKIDNDKQLSEIALCHKVVKELSQYEMTLFAPPSGSYNNATLEIANSLGYKTIMWSKDTIDWRDKDKSLIYSRATKNPSNGDLILMHPTEKTYEALDDIIKFYKNNNYNLVTVSENIFN